MWSTSWALAPAAAEAGTTCGRWRRQHRPAAFPAAAAARVCCGAAAHRDCRQAAPAPAACGMQVVQQLGSQPRAGAGRRQQLVSCRATKEAKPGAADVKEAHKIFDEVFISVKSGDGGNGEIVEAGRGKYVRNHKYHSGANQSKQIWLGASDPADGADGADVVLVCDPACDSLLHLHQRKAWVGARGAQGNPAAGSAGPKRSTYRKKAVTAPLEIPVPPGTVVKRKSSGQVLGELLQPGERLVVAQGGKGGSGVRAPSRLQKQHDLQRELKNAEKSGGEVVAVEDVNWRDDSRGLPGRQLGVHLLLRVVADVGIVGFPNAGKSSLLSALTRAQPEVAPYPFTTLMPNLGVMSSGSSSSSQQQAPVLADLPGLIEGAHMGRGLGRLFLRHLRRTRLLLHVVDASAADPGTDYLAVREELRMYNPEYVCRPHVVALNKMDLEDAGALRQEVADEVVAAARQLQQQHSSDVRGLTAPAAIVACSAVTGEGVQELAAAIQAVLQQPFSSQAYMEQQRHQQEDAAAALSAAVAAAVGGIGGQRTLPQQQELQSSVQSRRLEQDEDAGADLAGSSSNSSNSSANGDVRGSDDEDEAAAPSPLAADDPDAWLLELSEEELLALMDREEMEGQ